MLKKAQINRYIRMKNRLKYILSKNQTCICITHHYTNHKILKYRNDNSDEKQKNKKIVYTYQSKISCIHTRIGILSKSIWKTNNTF